MSFSRHRGYYHPWIEHNYFYTDNEFAETEAEVDSYDIESEMMDIKPDDIPDPIACASEYNPYLNYVATDTQDQPADVEIKKEIKEEPPDDDVVVVSLEKLATQLQELVMQSGNESSTALAQHVTEPVTQSNPDEQTTHSNVVPVVVSQQENISDAVSTFNIVVEPGSSSQFAVYVDPKEGANLGKVLLFSVKALPTDNSTEKETSETSSNSGESVSAISQENQTKIPHDMCNTLTSSNSVGENTSENLMSNKFNTSNSSSTNTLNTTPSDKKIGVIHASKSDKFNTSNSSSTNTMNTTPSDKKIGVIHASKSDKFNTSNSSSTNTMNTTPSDKKIGVIHASKSVSNDTSTSPQSADSHVSDSVGSNSLKSPQSANNNDEIHTSKPLKTYSVKPSQLFNKTYSKHTSKSNGSYTLRSSQFATKTYANHTLKSVSNNSFKAPKSVNNDAANSIRSNNSKSPQSLRTYSVKPSLFANKTYANCISKLVSCLKPPQSANFTNQIHTLQSVTSNNIKHSESTSNIDLIETPKPVDSLDLIHCSKSINSNTSKNSESAFLHSIKSSGTITVNALQFSKKMKLADISKSSIGKDMKDSKNFRIHSTNNNPNSILKSSQKTGLTNSHQNLSRLVKQRAQNSVRSSHSVSGNNLKLADTGTSQVAAVSRNREDTESLTECKKETQGTVQEADSTTADVTFLDHTYSLSLRTDNLSRVRNFPWPATTDIDGAPVQKRLRLTDDSYRPLDRMYGHMKQLQLELAMMDLERAKLDLEITRLQAQHEREIAELRLRNAEELIRMEADWCLLPREMGLWD